MSDKKLQYLNLTDYLDNQFSDDDRQSRDMESKDDNILVSEHCSLIQPNNSPSPRVLLPAELVALLAPCNPSRTVTDWHNPVAQMAYPLQSATSLSIEPKESQKANDKPIRALIAYADNEKDPTCQQINVIYRDRIDLALSTASRQKKRKINLTKHEIARENAWKHGNELETAHLILFLLDPNFVNTDYCYDDKLETAVSRHHSNEARVLPMKLRPCSWETATIEYLPLFPSCSISVSEQNIDRAFNDVMKGIKNALEDLISHLPILE